MKLEDVETIIHMFEKAKISHLELEIDNIKVKLDKPTQTVVAKLPVEDKPLVLNETPKDSSNTVVSPLVGTFHSSPYAEALPFVKVGDPVKKGAKLCIIEAMKVMNEITSPYEGVVKEILVKDNQMVQYDQKLFVIE